MLRYATLVAYLAQKVSTLVDLTKLLFHQGFVIGSMELVQPKQLSFPQTFCSMGAV
jgi:hypothetical protein